MHEPIYALYGLTLKQRLTPNLTWFLSIALSTELAYRWSLQFEMPALCMLPLWLHNSSPDWSDSDFKKLHNLYFRTRALHMIAKKTHTRVKDRLLSINEKIPTYEKPVSSASLFLGYILCLRLQFIFCKTLVIIRLYKHPDDKHLKFS
jgi:hypothetical protein